MTRHLFLTLALSISFLMLPITTNAATSNTVELEVPSMVCKFCPLTIRVALKKVPGVIDVTTEYKTKSATVTFNPEKTNVDSLMKATAKAGYESILKK